MRILFLGAGAVGGYFGGRLTASGADVTFLVREGRRAQLADGLKIQSPHGDASVPVKTLVAGEAADPFDIIVLTCKAYGLPGALDAIAPHVRDGTVIVPLLNGVAHIEAIEARFPTATIWGGVAQIPARLLADGTVEHYGQVHSIIVGPRAGQEASAPLARALVEAGKAAGFGATLSETIEQELWDKWTFLATLAAATCLMRGSVGQIIETDHGEALILGLLGECAAVTTAEGHAPDDKRLGFYRNALTEKGSGFRASMLNDMEAGNPTEADHVLGDMIRRANRHAIETPMIRAAYSRMQVYEAARKAG